MNGLMMDQSLLVKSIIEFAEKVNPDVEIVSVTADNPRHRYTYKEAFQRARQLANVIDRWGLSRGDRIATLAWNDYRHFEAYYAIASRSCCTALSLKTLKPRSTGWWITGSSASRRWSTACSNCGRRISMNWCGWFTMTWIRACIPWPSCP